MLKEKITQLAADFFEETVGFRRYLHQHPELSFEEYQTATFVKKQLDRLGIAYEAMADTGVVGLIQGA